MLAVGLVFDSDTSMHPWMLWFRFLLPYSRGDSRVRRETLSFEHLETLTDQIPNSAENGP
jgi:hypothetical protein